MEYLIVALGGLLIGLLTGYSLSKFSNRPRTVGSLRVDDSDPDGPYLFLQLHSENEIGVIMHSEYVTMKVERKNFVTQK